MPDQNRKEAHEIESLGEYKNADDTDEEGKMPLEDFCNVIRVVEGLPEEGDEFCAISLNVEPKTPLPPGMVGAVIKRGEDPMITRLTELERRNEQIMQKNQQIISHCRLLEIKQDGMLLVMTLVEYINVLQEAALEHAGLAARFSRFSEVFRSKDSDATSRLKNSVLYQKFALLTEHPFPGMARFRNTEAHPMVPLDEASILAFRVPKSCQIWKQSNSAPVIPLNPTEEEEILALEHEVMLKTIDHIFNAKTALAKIKAVPEAVAVLEEKLRENIE